MHKIINIRIFVIQLSVPDVPLPSVNTFVEKSVKELNPYSSEFHSSRFSNFGTRPETAHANHQIRPMFKVRDMKRLILTQKIPLTFLVGQLSAHLYTMYWKFALLEQHHGGACCWIRLGLPNPKHLYSTLKAPVWHSDETSSQCIV